ncbi:hypothetical protein APY03_4228 [Variovorax sp. WDL1]|nr:hypothetical protein APY03_4228 [Variovorax sp. WDL1]
MVLVLQPNKGCPGERRNACCAPQAARFPVVIHVSAWHLEGCGAYRQSRAVRV